MSEREYLGFYWNPRSRLRRDRTSLTKAFLFSVVLVLCIALLAHMAPLAFPGLQETSGQEQMAPAASQDDLAAAAPTAAQDEPDQSLARGCCYGQWYLLMQALNEVVYAKAG